MQAPASASSGSIDVTLSDPKLPSDGTPAPVPAVDSQPVSSGRVAAVAANEGTGRSKRLTNAAKDAIGGGVTRLGTSIGTIGEGVTRIGEASRKIPVVGSNIAALGEGISSVGESLTELPRVARTRRGRLLLRSLVVGFVLVAAWISVIVLLQVRGTAIPDFRPEAEKILVALSEGSASIEQLYESASPRFHEMERKEQFIDKMTDLNATLGKFREITSVNETHVSTGPTGRVGRVALSVAYEKGKAKATVSLHQDQGEWKLLGIGVELPPELKITQQQREERVQACKDPMDPKTCDLFVAANTILEQIRDGNAGVVWDNAGRVFQQQQERERFIEIHAENAQILGAYRRIIAVTEAKVIGGTNATYDVLVEFSKAQGVRAAFGFWRRARGNPWRLRSFKLVLPMPRAGERVVEEAPAHEETPATPAPATAPAPAPAPAALN